ncbi:MAG TPA: hypothetical protein VHL53_16040 [Acidimicrobiia bacterium]|nr:hypothetical protein [Acidimicrobiia bacterium]
MTFKLGNLTTVLVDQYDLSGYFDSSDIGRTTQAAKCTTYGQTAEAYSAGLTDGTLKLGGYYDLTADAIIAATLGQAAGDICSWAPEGLAAFGARARILTARTIEYAHSDPVGDMIRTALSLQASGGIDAAQSLHILQAETGSANGSDLDNGTSTANGWAANLHVTAYSGFTSVAYKLQDSPDGSVWTDLSGGAFTSVTAVGAQRLTGTGTVNRHVRAVWTKTGTGSATFALLFARR